MIAKYALAVEVNTLSFKPIFFHWPYDFRQSCNFHFFLPEKHRYNDTRYPSILQRERQHTVNIFRTLKNQHNPGFLELEILMKHVLTGTAIRFFYFVCLFSFEGKHATEVS